MSYRIISLTAGDFSEYFEHCLKVASESGKDGTPIFSPFDHRTPLKPADPSDLATLLKLPVEQPGWKRSFLLLHSGKIIGDLDLYGAKLASGLHRAGVGMGLQKGHRGKGQGEKLLRHAISWAREHPILEYLDLQVLHSNLPALRLYEKCGFQKTLVRKDAFRVSGQALDDIGMTLALRTIPGQRPKPSK